MGGDGLGRVPGDVPERRVCCAGEVERCDLQVAPVDVTPVQRDTTIGGHLLGGTTAHVVVFAMDACAAAADVVVGVFVVSAVDGGRSQIGAGIMSEGVIHHRALSGGAAGERSPERVMAVGAFSHKGSATVIGHAGEQVALRLVALCERHTVLYGKFFVTLLLLV